MKVRVKGDIDPELLVLGIKEGDVIEGHKDPFSIVGVVHFTRYKNEWTYNCSIWPDNYDVIEQ